jgi:hypothetical protein
MEARPDSGFTPKSCLVQFLSNIKLLTTAKHILLQLVAKPRYAPLVKEGRFEKRPNFGWFPNRAVQIPAAVLPIVEVFATSSKHVGLKQPPSTQ